MKRITIDNQSMKSIEETLKAEIREYAESRKRNVKTGLESGEFAAILVEKYALGLSKAVQLLFFDQERFGLFTDELCLELDPNYKFNLAQRNSNGKYPSIIFSERNKVPIND
jgi:hypothetical protein